MGEVETEIMRESGRETRVDISALRGLRRVVLIGTIMAVRARYLKIF